MRDGVIVGTIRKRGRLERGFEPLLDLAVRHTAAESVTASALPRLA